MKKVNKKVNVKKGKKANIKINKTQLIILGIIYLINLVLFVINIINFKVYLLPLIFELLIIILLVLNYKRTKKIDIDLITIIKKAVLILSLIVGIINNYIYINEILIKCLLSLVIILQVIVFIKLEKKMRV